MFSDWLGDHFGHRDSGGVFLVRAIQHGIVGLALCITAACGGGNSSPTSPTPVQPTFPQVSGNYAGTITFTLPELGQSVSCPATTVVTQTGNSVSIAPILLSGACAGFIESIPLGTVTIDQNGAFDDAENESFTDPTCGVYTGTGSGGFFGRELRFSVTATSSTCYNFSVTAVLSR